MRLKLANQSELLPLLPFFSELVEVFSDDFESESDFDSPCFVPLLVVAPFFA